MSENQNHQVVEPFDTLITYMEDDPETVAARAAYERMIRNRIESLDLSGTSFETTDYVEIQLTVQGQVKPITLPIRALSEDLANELGKKYQKAILRIPRGRITQVDANGNSSTFWDQDLNHPEYADRAIFAGELKRELDYAKFLHGLAIPLTDGKKMIWDSDPDGTRDQDAAIALLKKRGITEKIVRKVVDAIDALSERSLIQDETDFEKKYTPR